MNKQIQEGDDELGLPVWAREEAFPEAPGGFGWIDRKGGRHASLSLEDLSKTIRDDKDSAVNLVWTPASKFCQIPEEVEALTEPISEVRKRWAADDLADAQHRMKWFGGGVALLISYMAFVGMSQLKGLERANGLDMSFVEEAKWILHALSKSTTVGISLLGFLIFAFIPWYQAQKRGKEIRSGSRSKPIVPLIRFEAWLDAQKAPVTWGVLALVSLVFLTQIHADRSILGFRESIEDAGLVKPAYFAGEYWRILTAPMLHGGLIHFVMNALALIYLGKRLEVFARWPHVPAVFAFSALMAGEATARFTEATSVGASGGLMGWLGFLLVFETLHSRLVPRSSRRRLIGGVIMTGLIGLVGYRFIDNAAHFGGLVAGMIYAGIVFPKSGSVLRPKMNLTDRIIGFASLGLIAFSAALTVFRILG